MLSQAEIDTFVGTSTRSAGRVAFGDRIVVTGFARVASGDTTRRLAFMALLDGPK